MLANLAAKAAAWAAKMRREPMVHCLVLAAEPPNVPAVPVPAPPKSQTRRAEPPKAAPEKRRALTHKDIRGAAEVDLIRRHQGGDRTAAGVLLKAHAPFIVSVVKRYGKTIDFEDALQDGQMGFLTALNKFDPGRGFALTTYAKHWIRAAVSRARENDGLVRVPVNQQPAMRKTGELARFRPVSLDAPLGDDGERSMLDGFVDDGAIADVEIERTENRAGAVATIELAMRGMSEREHAVVRRRLLTEEPETLDEIGKSFGVSRERIRQIEAQAKTLLAKRVRASAG